MSSDKVLYVPTDANKNICTMCGKEFDKEAIVVKDWDLCPDCRKTYGDMAFLYCLTCKQIVTRIPTGLSMGILIKPGDILHVKECPTCHPGIVKSIPIEVQKYEASGRLP